MLLINVCLISFHSHYSALNFGWISYSNMSSYPESFFGGLFTHENVYSYSTTHLLCIYVCSMCAYGLIKDQTRNGHIYIYAEALFCIAQFLCSLQIFKPIACSSTFVVISKKLSFGATTTKKAYSCRETISEENGIYRCGARVKKNISSC